MSVSFNMQDLSPCGARFEIMSRMYYIVEDYLEILNVEKKY